MTVRFDFRVKVTSHTSITQGTNVWLTWLWVSYKTR